MWWFDVVNKKIHAFKSFHMTYALTNKTIYPNAKNEFTAVFRGNDEIYVSVLYNFLEFEMWVHLIHAGERFFISSSFIFFLSKVIIYSFSLFCSVFLFACRIERNRVNIWQRMSRILTKRKKALQIMLSIFVNLKFYLTAVGWMTFWK